MSAHPTRIGWFSAGEVECDPPPPARDHPYRLVLLGPPGVGKGTQALLLSEHLRACHLSTGDLFRAAKCQCAPSLAMQAAIDVMNRGELVREDLVIQMVRERSKCIQCHGGFLLDGFPRNVHQAEALSALLDELRVTLDAVVSYELPLDEIVARLSGRRTCSECRAVYHVTSQPPSHPDRCDHCGAALVQRDDDRPEAIRVRMQTYESETQPLTDYYSRSGKLLRVPAHGAPREICRRMLAALHALDVPARVKP